MSHFAWALSGLLGAGIVGRLDDSIQATGPELVGDVGLAQSVGNELEHWGGPIRPELLNPFDPPVDMLDGGFDGTADERQVLFSVLGISHPLASVGQVGQRTGNLSLWRARFIFLGEDQLFLSLL
jgi:hypothetical protein